MKFLTNLTLGKKATILAMLGLAVGVGIFSFLGIRAVNQATDAMLEDRLTTAGLVADYIDEVLGRALNVVTDTAQTVNPGAVADLKPQVDNLSLNLSHMSIAVNSIYLLDGRGQIVWSDPASLTGNNIAFYPGISASLQSGKASISSLALAPVGNAPVVFLDGPTPNGGVLAVAIDLAQSSISGFVQPIRLGQTGYVEIVDQNGVVVARTDPGPKLSPFEKSDHSGRFAALIAAGQPTRGLCHTCHEPVSRVERKDVLAFVPLTSASWGVVIRQSEAEALAPINQLRWNLVIFGGGLMIIALLFVLLSTRDIVGRIRMLTSASQRIAEGDLSSPITPAREDEIGTLGRTFEEMRVKLQTSYGQLEQRTGELASLLSVSEILTSLSDLSDLDTALGNALDKTLEIMNEDSGAILLLDEESQQLRYHAHRNLPEEYVQNTRYGLGEGIDGRAAQSGESVLVNDLHNETQPVLPNMDGLHTFASVPLSAKHRVLGVLDVASRQTGRFSLQDMRLLEGIGRQIAIAIENARLHQEVQRKDEIRGELLREIFSVQEEERRRIARELHDETSQTLASLAANLEAVTRMLPANIDNAKVTLKKAQGMSVGILDEVHRLIYQLRPSLLDDLGLVSATRWLLENNLKPSGMDISFKTYGREKRLPPQLEATLFRVVQEAVNNVARHAEAKSAGISLHFRKSLIKVVIKDDGQGFDVQEALTTKERPRGLGLIGMRERVELMNGTLTIMSHPGRGGTEIIIEIPLNSEVKNG